MLFVTLVASSLMSAEWTSNRATPALVTSRLNRYAGDGAASALVNWAKSTPNVGRDSNPDQFPGDPPCVLNVPTATGPVTATCVGDRFSGELPTGTWPDQTLLQPRTVTIVACRRGQNRANSQGPCDASAGDSLLLRARVRFDVTTDNTNAPASNVPEVLAWKHLS